MMNRTVLLIASLAVLAGMAFLLWPSDERVVRRRLNAVARTLTVPANDSKLGRVSRAAQLRHYLADDIRLRNGAQEIASRDALLGFLVAMTPPPGGFSVDFVDTHVTVATDGQTARVDTDVKITSHDTGGRPTVDAREATFEVAKREGEWVITAAETKETLRRP
jgi:hypothetical protein